MSKPNKKSAPKKQATTRKMRSRCKGKQAKSASKEQLPRVVGALLRRRHQTLALAESCTGGLVSERITSIPGSSDYFLEGVVVYSNQAKGKTLAVHKSTLKRYGAVSEHIAREMALGIKSKSTADWGLAVTGIAGPGGGTRSKPVGLVYLGIAGPGDFVRTRRLNLTGDRQRIRRSSATAALNLLRQSLIEKNYLSKVIS
jgi:nicotinamide-nucleotide amidase